MKLLIQRVRQAKVIVEGRDINSIKGGLVLLVGVGKDDSSKDIEYLARKLISLRIFEDEKKKMNLDIRQVNGEILSVPQFTLFADLRRGNRPGFELSAKPDIAKERWKRFNDLLKDGGITVKEGIFGVHMQVALTNDGPVTIWLDSKKAREEL